MLSHFSLNLFLIESKIHMIFTALGYSYTGEERMSGSASVRSFMLLHVAYMTYSSR